MRSPEKLRDFSLAAQSSIFPLGTSVTLVLIRPLSHQVGKPYGAEPYLWLYLAYCLRFDPDTSLIHFSFFKAEGSFLNESVSFRFQVWVVSDDTKASVGLWKNCTNGICEGALSYANEGMY